MGYMIYIYIYILGFAWFLVDFLFMHCSESIPCLPR